MRENEQQFILRNELITLKVCCESATMTFFNIACMDERKHNKNRKLSEQKKNQSYIHRFNTSSPFKIQQLFTTRESLIPKCVATIVIK